MVGNPYLIWLRQSCPSLAQDQRQRHRIAISAIEQQGRVLLRTAIIGPRNARLRKV
jgi:hypothetical protein